MKATRMYVIKRDGRREEVHFDKITSRIQKLCYGLNMDFVDPDLIISKVAKGIYIAANTAEIDNIIAETTALLAPTHPDYALLAGRVAVSNLHKVTKSKFSEAMDQVSKIRDPRSAESPILAPKYFKIIKDNATRLNSVIVDARDYEYNYFSFKILEKSFLLRASEKVVERPQYLLMRLAIGIHGEDIDAAIETYDLLSQKYYMHDPATLALAATCNPKLSSSFAVSTAEDSIEGIMKTMDFCARISKYGGEVGVNVHCVRANGSSIARTEGTSNGLVPMLRVYNSLTNFVGQGFNKKPSVFTFYLEPWHPDIFEFLDLKKKTGNDDQRARDLFYGLWVPDIFMKRVEANAMWSLICPHRSPELYKLWGTKFAELYEQHEKEGRASKIVSARCLWIAILDCQMETGFPHIIYKDSCNRKTNHQILGTVTGSNTSTEMIAYTSAENVAVCHYASIALNKFVTEDKKYDFGKLKKVTKIVTKTLNKVIDVNEYPLIEAERYAFRNRPIGIGVQGLADTFILLRCPYDSKAAQLLNKQIFETIYYATMEASSELAVQQGRYELYHQSPVSRGIFQYSMWKTRPTELWDWDDLKDRVRERGVRNSLLVALMPTTITAQILGNSESFEPYTSYVSKRSIISGEFQIYNHHLVNDLIKLGLWSEEMRQEIIVNHGSIQDFELIPKSIREIYKTAWEIPIKITINMAADRGAFIDQNQSFNVYCSGPSYKKLTSIHFYGWKKELKTGMYNLKIKPGTAFSATKRQLPAEPSSSSSSGPFIGKNFLRPSDPASEVSSSLENLEDCLSRDC